MSVVVASSDEERIPISRPRVRVARSARCVKVAVFADPFALKKCPGVGRGILRSLPEPTRVGCIIGVFILEWAVDFEDQSTEIARQIALWTSRVRRRTAAPHFVDYRVVDKLAVAVETFEQIASEALVLRMCLDDIYFVPPTRNTQP